MDFTKPFLSLLFLALLSFCITASAQEDLLNKEITIAFEDISVKESLEKLEKVADVSTAYNELEIADSKVNITFEKELISEVLEALLASDNLTYKVIGNTITVYRKKDKAQKAEASLETKSSEYIKTDQAQPIPTTTAQKETIPKKKNAEKFE